MDFKVTKMLFSTFLKESRINRKKDLYQTKERIATQEHGLCMEGIHGYMGNSFCVVACVHQKWYTRVPAEGEEKKKKNKWNI